MDRVLNALQKVHAQAGAARNVNRVPGLDKPGKVAEFCSAWGEQVGQDLGPQRHSAALVFGGFKGLGEHGRSHRPFLLVLCKSNQLAALLWRENTPGWRLGGCRAGPGRVFAGNVSHALLLALPDYRGGGLRGSGFVLRPDRLGRGGGWLRWLLLLRLLLLLWLWLWLLLLLLLLLLVLLVWLLLMLLLLFGG